MNSRRSGREYGVLTELPLLTAGGATVSSALKLLWSMNWARSGTAAGAVRGATNDARGQRRKEEGTRSAWRLMAATSVAKAVRSHRKRPAAE